MTQQPKGESYIGAEFLYAIYPKLVFKLGCYKF